MASPTQKTHRFVIAMLAVIASLSLYACGSDEDDLDPGNAADAPDYSELEAKSPPRLAALYAGGGGLLSGGTGAYEEQIGRLEGYPIVVNKWASWCGPCRAEFPYLQEQVSARGDEVAFVGINSDDSTDAAETFLRDHPVPYPSFSDPDSEIARSLDALEFPDTVFYDAKGEIVYIHRGVYAGEEDLAADIDRYSQGG